MSDEHDGDNASQGSSSSSGSHLCCCICHSAVDYSDREAFFQEDEDVKEKHFPLLPTSLYDEQNAMVLCDSCDRPYHQRCHFVPLISLPRGDWHCLICKTEGANSNNKNNSNSGVIYPFPPMCESHKETTGETTQQEWEFVSRNQKACEWKREFARLKRALSNQLQHIRLAQATLRAHTSTKRAQQHVSLKSQILCQTFLKLATAKLRIRQWFASLERVLKGDDDNPNSLECRILDEFLSQNPDQVSKWFPYGRDMEKRIVPRLEQHDEVPAEVVISNDKKKSDKDDDDDLISLDELRCCICFKGDATDENDLILCDGAGCFRAYHMQCVIPHITNVGEEHEDEDWFCPLCTCMASLLAEVQSEYTGDEWGGDDDSIHSWGHARDVFPEAPHEYQMALLWKEGKHNSELIQFLSELLGMPATHDQSDSKDNDEDEEDDEEDDDFDDEKNSQASSLDSLHDLSSVEVKIDANELDALSVDSADENGGRRTRSSRATSAESSSVDDSRKPNDGSLDKSNIVEGKRRRKQVDYRKLNDSMFGGISDTEAARLFDDRDDEFQNSPGKRKRRRKSSSSSSSPSTSSSEDSVSNESSLQPKKANRAKRRPRKEKQSSEASLNSVSSESSSEPRKVNRTKGRPRKKKQSSVSSSTSVSNESSSEKKKTSRANRRPRKTKQSSEAPSNGTTSQPEARTSPGKTALKKPAAAKMARKKLPKSASSSHDSKSAVEEEETRSVPPKNVPTRAETRSSTKVKSPPESNAASNSLNGRGRKKQALKPSAQNGRKLVNGNHLNGMGRTRNKPSKTR